MTAVPPPSAARIDAEPAVDKAQAPKAGGPTPKQWASNATRVVEVDASDIQPRSASVLDNLDITPPTKKIVLERCLLLKFDQKGEGKDEFGLFQQGLENDNSLYVDNRTGTLEIEFASFPYRDGASDGETQAITCLEFSAKAQRYLVRTSDDTGPGYDFLVNVECTNDTARLYMREYEHKDAKWSDWKKIVDYGA